jgi:hypothetical protein
MKKRTRASTTLFVATALALVLSLATTFSWFSSRFVTEEFTFTTAKLASTVTLYKAQDFDLDGYPDMVIGADDASSYEIFIPQTDNSTEQIKYFTDSVLFFLQDPDPKVNQVMISYITGAILPIVSLCMTSMVVNVAGLEHTEDQPIDNEPIELDIPEMDGDLSKIVY